MVRKVSAMTVRDRLGQILEEVYYRGDAVIIERAGRPMAVLVPPAEYERLRARRASRSSSGASNALAPPVSALPLTDASSAL